MKRICLLLEFKVKVVPVDAMKAYVRVELQWSYSGVTAELWRSYSGVTVELQCLALLTFEEDEGELSVSRPGRLNPPISSEK